METRAVVLAIYLAVGLMVAGKSTASFKDCYTKCFVFCMIEPSQTICSCTTHCFQDCIFQGTTPSQDSSGNNNHLAFCKLGCAFAMCSRFSTNSTPNGDKVDGCVGTCSSKCRRSYSWP